MYIQLKTNYTFSIKHFLTLLKIDAKHLIE